MTTPSADVTAAADPVDGEFDLAAALPRGTVVLEASAGTGKTYAIAALVTRAVAEGVCTLPEMLVVTFTRAATAELRDRVRRRLVDAERHLRAVLTGGDEPTASDDPVLTQLAAADTEELERRLRRLTDAVRDVDAATIATIHGFTQQVLRSVGLAADVPRDLTLLEDDTALVEEVTDDVYLRSYLGRADLPARPSRHVAGEIGAILGDEPVARLRPTPDDPDEDGAERATLALELRSALAARKRRDGVLGYDDLLVALRDALLDPDRGAAAVAVLRERYRWALVDEFQDTDPVQWEILRRAFRDPADPDRALVLIGDPKQAIYSFRGADVRAYLDATRRADARYGLATNYRSDGALLAGLDALLSGTVFGDERITFAPVRPSDRHRDVRVVDDRDGAALQLRVHDPARGQGNAPAVRQRLAEDVAATLVDQLGRVRVGRDGRALRPEDVAVLVRTNAEARIVQRQLRAARIASVVNGVGSVLATAASDDWRWLLEAVERPTDPARIRRLALSAWVGWDATRLAAASDDALDDLHDAASRWAHVVGEHGVAALERAVLAEQRVGARLLGVLGGERDLTDLRHVGELLHVAELEEDRGVSSLLAWLLTARAEAGDTPTPSEEQARRLESDARAVQILTVHRSKGLEYPVVLVPFAWSAGQGVGAPVAAHDVETHTRVVDVGPSTRAGFDEVKAVAQRETAGEHLRLLYVATTRARHRAIVWWQSGGAKTSPLARVLFGRDEHGRVHVDRDATLPKGAAQLDALHERFADTPEVSVTAVPPETADATGAVAAPPAPPPLEAARFDRPLDRAWRRTSYSAITARRHAWEPVVHGGVATEPDVTATDDEPDEAAPDHLAAPVMSDLGAAGAAARGDGAAEDGALGVPVPLGEVTGGTAFGTLVHAVLERVDLRATDLPAEVAAALGDERGRHRVNGLTDDQVPPLVDGLVAAIRTPLGPVAGRITAAGATRWRRLADIPRADRRDELEFELPLAGGDDAQATDAAATVSRIADLLDRPARDGGLTDDDPLRAVGYPDRLRGPDLTAELRGYLTGSIDLLLRVPGDDGGHRFVVVDHKTNRLGGAAPTVGAYRPAALTAAMVEHDYPLQALLYQVAVHRYLRWRLPGYEPARHLGGALYLFLRGMTGPQVPELDGGPCGVFAWAPPPTLITDLSDLLAGTGDDAVGGGAP